MHDGVGPLALLHHIQFVAHPMAFHGHGVDSEGAVLALVHVLMGQMKHFTLLMLHLVEAQLCTSAYARFQHTIHHSGGAVGGRMPKNHLRLGLVLHHNAVAWACCHVVACGVVVHQHGAVQGHPLGHMQEHAILGVSRMHGAHPFAAVVPTPVEVRQVAFVHSLTPRHAHHAVGHRQIARLRHHVPVDQDNAVRVQSGNRVGLHVGRPSFRSLGSAHRMGQHGRDGAVLPSF